MQERTHLWKSTLLFRCCNISGVNECPCAARCRYRNGASRRAQSPGARPTAPPCSRGDGCASFQIVGVPRFVAYDPAEQRLPRGHGEAESKFQPREELDANRDSWAKHFPGRGPPRVARASSPRASPRGRPQVRRPSKLVLNNVAVGEPKIIAQIFCCRSISRIANSDQSLILFP